MPGGNMPNAMQDNINANEQGNEDELDAQELADALKDLSSGEIKRGLNNKLDEIKKVDGLEDAVKDLIISFDKHEGLNDEHKTALYFLLDSFNGGESEKIKKRDLGQVIDEKREELTESTIGKENIANILEDDYTYTMNGWHQEYQENLGNIGVAVIVNEVEAERYHLNFSIDGDLRLDPGSKVQSIDTIYDSKGKTKEGVEDKVAYIEGGNLVIETRELFEKKENIKRLGERLSNILENGLVLTRKADGGKTMEISYIPDDVLLDQIASMITDNPTIDALDRTIQEAEDEIKKLEKQHEGKTNELESMRLTSSEQELQGIREKNDNEFDTLKKEQENIIQGAKYEKLTIYKTYAQEHVDEVFELGNSFDLGEDFSLKESSDEISLRITGEKEIDTLKEYISLDDGDLYVTIEDGDYTIYRKVDDGYQKLPKDDSSSEGLEEKDTEETTETDTDKKENSTNGAENLKKTTHTVIGGDTLSDIARDNDVTITDIKKLNSHLFDNYTDNSGKKRKVDGSLIYPGDEIILSEGGEKNSIEEEIDVHNSEDLLTVAEPTQNENNREAEVEEVENNNNLENFKELAKESTILINKLGPDGKSIEEKIKNLPYRIGSDQSSISLLNNVDKFTYVGKTNLQKLSDLHENLKELKKGLNTAIINNAKDILSKSSNQIILEEKIKEIKPDFVFKASEANGRNNDIKTGFFKVPTKNAWIKLPFINKRYENKSVTADLDKDRFKEENFIYDRKNLTT